MNGDVALPSTLCEGRFELLRPVSQGTTGTVYEAFDRQRQLRMALKVLRRANPDTIYRFKTEFRALADIAHPNLIEYGELVNEDGTWFFTMELVDGSDFGAYVSGDTGLFGGSSLPFIEAKLRDGFAQLALGLCALHRAGKVHRDVKPSNVLVTHEGRVVLVDFGLAASLDRKRLSEGDIVGTVSYMSPEQAAGKSAGPAADWYGAGVMLYEALTGELPFTGPPLEILDDKQRFDPLPPRSLCPGAPADLDALCMDLLHRQPSERPSGPEVLQRLGIAEDSAAASQSALELRRFIGRASELEVMRKAFRDAGAGAPVTLCIRGPSGTGKSALIAEFVRDLEAREPDVLVLAGRCYEHEAVLYKAFDGPMEALARYMAELDDLQAGPLVPAGITMLVRLFPILRRIRVVAAATSPVVAFGRPLPPAPPGVRCVARAPRAGEPEPPRRRGHRRCALGR